MNRLVVCVVMLAAAVSARAADTNALPPAVARRYQAGLTKQNQADLAATPAEARRFYREAIAEYEAGVELQPDNYPCQLAWGVCLAQLAVVTTDPEEVRQCLLNANQRFAVAAECPRGNHLVFDQWANLLLGNILGLVEERADKIVLLRETATVCERGRNAADSPTPRAQMEHHLGRARFLAAELAADPTEQRALLEDAVTHFRAAANVVTVGQAVYQSSQPGLALLRLGKLAGDQNLLREAAAEFETALKFYPNQYPTHYSLAATYSLLGDTDQAAAHLAVAIDHDPSGEVARRAATDPDLAPIRSGQAAAYTAALDRRRRRDAEAKAAALFRQALRAQQAAERTNSPAAATALLQQATALYQQTVEATPDHYPAQALFATALAQLANLSPRLSDQQHHYLDAARARFRTAALCPEVDPQLYDQWATFLLAACYPLLTQPPDQHALLQDARQVLAAGIARARFSGLRGRLETQLGTTLVLLAQLPPPAPAVPAAESLATSPTALYSEALEHFRAAEVAERTTRSASYYELWGIALLRVGQATKEPRLVRQATERLLTSLELKADNPTVHYNLACAYAQLRQPDQALRHLERSLARDPQGLFYTSAEKDPDLEPLRRSAAGRRLFHGRQPLGQDDHHTVSDK